MRAQFRHTAIAAALAMSLAGAISSANAAQSYSFDFGTLLSGSYQPGASFASMSITSTDDMTFTFDLKANDLNSLFTSGAFISTAIFNTTSGSAPTSTAISPGSWGVSSVTAVSAPNVGGITFDFGSGFPTSGAGGGVLRLTANEEVLWSVKFASVQSSLLASPYAALHVQGLTDAQGSSAWYTPTTPVPEPETYAMLLAGVGILGVMTRRRKLTH